jgi:hypothetical protein
MKSTLYNRILGFVAIVMLLFLGTQASAQVGCTNSNACNYNPSATVDNGSCTYTGYFIPVQLNAGPAVLACNAPTGYWFPDQTCLNQIITNDPFCLNNNWDLACQAAYNSCIGCAAPAWSIPYEIGSGPAIFGCNLPAGYQLADAGCITSVMTNDNYCNNYAWDSACQNAYNTCLYGCSYATWHIPVDVSAGPAVYACFPPAGYWTPNQACMQQIIANDPFCVNNTWDIACQQAYNMCAFGCTTASWHIPYAVGISPAVFACTTPQGYYTPDQECVISVIESDNFCIVNTWDTACNNAYNFCAFGCTTVSWYIPFEVGSAMPVQGCTVPLGYWEPDQECVIGVLGSVGFCGSVSWDALCQFNYDQCAFGCIDGQWFIPYDPTTFGQPAVYACSPPNGYQYVGNQNCLVQILDDDPYCSQDDWDSACNSSLINCSTGCTYPTACNYNAIASIDNQSCIFPGCTDPTATNYDVNAGCDDGSCTFDSCAADLNNDGIVGSGDLLDFLSAFGSACP